MTDRDAFLAGILANPDADLPRLAYADWLDEQGNEGDSARAEFIRLQCELVREPTAKTCGYRPGFRQVKFCGDPACRSCAAYIRQWELWTKNLCRWKHDQVIVDCAYHIEGEAPCEDAPVHAIFRRGFVDEVRGLLAWLNGGECDFRRDGDIDFPCTSGQVYGMMECWDRVFRNGWRDCPRCHGTGRTTGHLHDIVRTQPVTRVVVSDREPVELPGLSGTRIHGWHWPVGEQRNGIPWDVYDLMPEMPYPTADAARSALSDALIHKHKESPT